MREKKARSFKRANLWIQIENNNQYRNANKVNEYRWNLSEFLVAFVAVHFIIKLK